MVGTYDIGRRDKAKQRKDRRNKQIEITRKCETFKIIPGSHTKLGKFYTEFVVENR